VIAISRDLNLNASDERIQRGGLFRGWKGAVRYCSAQGTRHCIAHDMAEREPEQGVAWQRCGTSGWCGRCAHG
jgi:hypothetical protein